MILPIFVFDSRETFWPVGVEESLALHGYEWDDGHDDIGVAGWTAPRKPGARHPARLDFPANMPQPDLPPVAYHRVVSGANLWWQQFWLWYVYNPWSIAGQGKHEGDWEFVQIGCRDREGVYPVLVTGSQHHAGGKREHWACELRVARPVIYVARGSHANYFAPGAQGGVDHCDGGGLALRNYKVRGFGPWSSWPGRWGNSTGEGRSPESPGRQGIRWKSPAAFHAAAKG